MLARRGQGTPSGQGDILESKQGLSPPLSPCDEQACGASGAEAIAKKSQAAREEAGLLLKINEPLTCQSPIYTWLQFGECWTETYVYVSFIVFITINIYTDVGCSMEHC